MKNLTQEQFEDRIGAELRAKGIFIDSGMTNNITLAFELYQTVLAERERDIFLKASGTNNEPPSPMDRYERPKCPDCGAEMRVRVLGHNDEGFKTQWLCSNKDCDLVLSSDKSIDEWMQELKVKE